jgi:hypothetical protein
MSTEEDKAKHSKRLLKDENAIAKQLKIAKASGHTKYVREPHRLAKHHAMDCGNPQCYLCGNPRNHGEVTAQEKRMVQDIDTMRNKHSNGAANDQDF